MSVAKITETYLDNIADAIRFKRMSEDTYTPPEMADAIMAIQGGPNAVAVVNSVDPDTGGLIKTIVGTDISSDTVTSGSLLKGYTAHMADGTFIEGEYQGGAGDITQDENGYIILGKDGYEGGGGTPTVTGLSAVYTQSGAVYIGDDFSVLYKDLVVTATISNSLSVDIAPTAYTLSGQFTVGTSTITVSYGGKTTTFNVVVTQLILYELPEAKTFNGSSDYVNTGVQLLSVDRDFTITFTATNGTVDVDDPIFHCLTEASPYPGLALQRAPGSNNYQVGGLTTALTQTACSWASGYTNKCVFRHTAGTSNYIFSSKSNTTLNSPITITAESGHVTTDKNLLIGCYQQTNGTLGRFWNGTINDFTIYNRVLTDDEVATYLAG